MAEDGKPKGSVKRDWFLSIEQDVQKRWDDAKLFEVNAPKEGEAAPEKYFVTFPYPYMNGRLHLGHTFSLSKCEFAVGYQRLKGKRCLFPFAFHVSGVPIKVAADKLKREMELYGNPPVFPKPEEAKEPVVEEKDEDEHAKGKKIVRKKAKVAAKTDGSVTYQWQIMKLLGMSDEEIPAFADTQHWLDYFPPHAITDLKRMGLHVDWRRSFITTPANPYYDAFVRWQFRVLEDMGKVKFGNRLTMYSPKDGQPCMDHDRQTGEGVGPQEYTLIKMRVLEPMPAVLAPLAEGGRKVFFIAGTLRPETMYGQTNCWIRPDMEYGAYALANGDVVVCGEHAARNMAYQGLTATSRDFTPLAQFKGSDIMGAPLRAPMAKYERVYALPMLTIKPDKGTGVVTSVPSDSPDDFAALRDLKKKQALREKFGVTDDMVLPFEVVPIIDIPGYSDRIAEKACEVFKVTSQNDREKLALAKEEAYKRGFYDGVMLVGDHKGKKVEDAKPLIKAELVKAGEAILYSEPEKEVMSRSGDKCVIALCDQWFLDYGEEEWRALTEECLSYMELYMPDIKRLFEYTLGWLKNWAISRSFGLGTKLPCDEQYIIDSLSDSTIYMSYYTIAHLLQGGVLDGSKGSPVGIKAEQLTREVFDYIFLSKTPVNPPENTGIDAGTLQDLRREFRYWYPLDLRVSGKDLVGNHLTFCLYNHTAVWADKDMWPRSMRANGHLHLNSAKMSKSTGNFLTLSDAIDMYGADCMRFTLADSGDTAEDANFVGATANAAILRLHNEMTWAKEMRAPDAGLRTGPCDTFADRVFIAEINNAIKEGDELYEKLMFREALKAVFYTLQTARDRYRLQSKKAGGMHKDLVDRFMEVQAILLSPICPHYCEHMWQDVLGKSGSVLDAGFPQAGPIDASLRDASDYLDRTTHEFRLKMSKGGKKGGKKGKEPAAKPTKGVIYVAREFSPSQKAMAEYLRSVYDETKGGFPKDVMKGVSELPEIKTMTKIEQKKSMSFLSTLRAQTEESGLKALDLNLSFSEMDVVHENLDFIANSLDLLSLEVCDARESGDEKVIDTCQPGKPLALFQA